MTAVLAGIPDLDAATHYLYGLPRGSTPVGLARAAELFRRLGSPQDAVRTVHIAGTAGKGSVSAFVAAILDAHGFRVGTHLSPHVRSIRERVQLGGRPVPAGVFTEAVRTLQPVVEVLQSSTLGTPTFFEALNAVAFTTFAARGLDYAVVETGVGGRLDATNTITRADKLAVIGRIGLDHTHLLGETVAEIAEHKAGILTVGGHGIVLRHHQASVRNTVSAVAQTRGCTVETVDPHEIRCTADEHDTVLHVGDHDLRLGLQGRHQGVNAVLAIQAARHLAARDGWALDGAAVRIGLAHARLPGRFERHRVAGRDVILDGAHNNVKLVALTDTVRALYPRSRATWVLAAKADKDLQSMLATIAPLATRVIATRLPDDGAGPAAPSIPAQRVFECARAHGIDAVAIDDPGAAVRYALTTGDPGPIVVTGSFLHLAAAGAALEPGDIVAPPSKPASNPSHFAVID